MDFLLIKEVVRTIEAYCYKKGAKKGQGINNFVPHDSIAAFAMAEYLIKKQDFEKYIAIAPEGFTYGYFFEKLGIELMAVNVDYPPIKLTTTDDLLQIKGKKVLIIEDDIIGGKTLRMVVSELIKYDPSSLSLFLGHSKSIQHLQNVPKEIVYTYVAEDVLDYKLIDMYVERFSKFFRELL